MMNILQIFNRFDLNNNFIIDDNIQSKSNIKIDFIVDERNSNLIPNLQTSFG